jgi:predicted N-acetyltransferase YhbS
MPVKHIKRMIRYRLATKEDNQQLIALTAGAGMAGDTALRIDRKPDFFSLLKMRGPTKVFVALENEIIIGSLCVTLQQVYVGGQVYPLQYIGDFKVAKAYRNKGIGLQLCDQMANYVIAKGSDLAFLNVSKGNNKPLSFFSNRPNVPDFENIGIFNIHQLIGIRRIKLHPQYKITISPVTNELIAFLNTHYSKYQLGLVITKEKLEDVSVFTVMRDKIIIGAMCLIDTMTVKQNVATALSWKIKFLLKTVNALAGLTGISKMPVLNEPVRMLYIKYLAINGLDKQVIKLLVNHARNIVYQKSYSFVSIGLHEKDPLNDALHGMSKITFNSVGMLLSIKNNKALIEKVKQGIPFEDYSLV